MIPGTGAQQLIYVITFVIIVKWATFPSMGVHQNYYYFVSLFVEVLSQVWEPNRPYYFVSLFVEVLSQVWEPNKLYYLWYLWLRYYPKVGSPTNLNS